MVESLILLEGQGIKKKDLRISLANAKQIVIGDSISFGIILHIAASSIDDLTTALIGFAKVKGVTGVVTLMIRTLN